MSPRHPNTSGRRTCWVCAFLALALPALAGAAEPNAEADRAWIELLRGRRESAVRSARAALARDHSDPRAVLCLIEALQASGRTDEAARAFIPGSGKRAGKAAVQLADGKLAHLRRDYAAAERPYRRALTDYEARRDSNGILVASEQLASLLRDAGRPAEAGRLFQRTLTLANTRGRDLEALSARYGLAYTRIHLGRNDEAGPYLERARRDAERLDLPLWTGDVETLLAVLSWFGMDLEGTVAHYSSALRAYERAGHVARQAAALRNLAAAQGSLGELPAAIEKLRRAQGMARRIGDRREESICLEHLGSMNHALGGDRVALAQWRDAARLGGDLWPPEWMANLRLNIGRLLWSEGRREEAVAELRAGLTALGSQASQRGRAELQTQISRCLREAGRTDLALQEVEAARRIARRWNMPLFEAAALHESGLCRLARGELALAERDFSASERIARARGFYDLAIAIHTGHARAARAGGRAETALLELHKAMAIAEGVRRRARTAAGVQARAFERTRPIYEESIDLLYEMHRHAPRGGFDRRAFDLAQRAKARSFLDLLSEARVDLKFRGGPEFQRREREILARIAALEDTRSKADAAGARRFEAEIERLEDELAIVESRLRARDPRYAELQYPQPATLEEIQRRVLAPGELLVEYVLGDRASYLWTVTKTDFRFHALPGRRVIENQARALVTLLRDYNLLGPHPTYFVRPAREMFETLLAPAAVSLQGCRRLIVAPDGILHYLPFEALLVSPVNESKPRPDFSSLPYLVLQTDVCYVPSISALVHLRAMPPDARRKHFDLLATGSPTEPDASTRLFVTAATGGELRPIPEAAAELQAVKRLYPHANRVALEGARATLDGIREASRNRSFRVVHFACHGVFNERRPQLSGLVLSPDARSQSDGFLSVGEVFGLDLECEQVVLSACASALGERVDGEGLVGLTRAFQYAGARSVVAALWEVSGSATSRFMADYHGLLRSGSADRARILAEAKRRCIRSRPWWPGAASARSHPFFWAPFVLTGTPTGRV